MTNWTADKGGPDIDIGSRLVRLENLTGGFGIRDDKDATLTGEAALAYANAHGWSAFLGLPNANGHIADVAAQLMGIPAYRRTSFPPSSNSATRRGKHREVHMDNLVNPILVLLLPRHRTDGGGAADAAGVATLGLTAGGARRGARIRRRLAGDPCGHERDHVTVTLVVTHFAVIATLPKACTGCC